jgi:hypothetical protein
MATLIATGLNERRNGWPTSDVDRCPPTRLRARENVAVGKAEDQYAVGAERSK